MSNKLSDVRAIVFHDAIAYDVEVWRDPVMGSDGELTGANRFYAIVLRGQMVVAYTEPFGSGRAALSAGVWRAVNRSAEVNDRGREGAKPL